MKPFRVVLVSPNEGFVPDQYYAPTEHLGLAYLAATLRQAGFPVHLIDAYALNLPYDGTLAEVVAAAPDVVGFTAEYNTFEHAMRMARAVRDALPRAVICVGGEHATFAADQVLAENPCIDVLVRGEGEQTLVEVAEGLLAGRAPEATSGAWFRRGPDVMRNPDRPAITDLDTLPFPARDTLDRCLERGMRPALSILGSRGCHGRCSFCNAHRFFNLGGGRSWRSRTAKNVVDELGALLHRYQDRGIYDVVYFADENFVGPGRSGLERAGVLADEIVARGVRVSFEIFCRADSFDGQEWAVQKLAAAGLRSALVGLESGDQGRLRGMKKGTTVDQNLRTIELFAKYHVVTSSSGFLMFNPYSTLDELAKNARFLMAVGQATMYNMSLRVLLYPGIQFTAELGRDGLLLPGFGHRNVAGYRFRDARVQVMAEALSSVERALVLREDATHRYIDLQTAAFLRHLETVGRRRGVEGALAGVRAARRRANAVSYRAFMRALRLAERGWEDDAFARLQGYYRSSLPPALDAVNEAFEEFLRRVEAAVDAGGATSGAEGN